MILDAHCHAARSGELMTAPWTSGAPLGAYLRRARAAGIDKTVIMPSFPLDSRRANREIADIVAGRPSRLIGFAWIHPRRDAGRVAQLVAEAVSLGLRGIKVHGHEAMPTREVCECACRWGLPMLVDVNSRPHPIDLIAPRFRGLTIIVAHLGSFADDWRAHQTVIDQLRRHPNVFADTSGVRRFDYLAAAARDPGPHKLLYASDGPWLHPGLELHKIRLLGLPSADERRVLGENASDILGGRRPSRLRLRPPHRDGQRRVLVKP
jgi:hypothetical protein